MLSFPCYTILYKDGHIGFDDGIAAKWIDSERLSWIGYDGKEKPLTVGDLYGMAAAWNSVLKTDERFFVTEKERLDELLKLANRWKAGERGFYISKEEFDECFKSTK